MTEEEKPQKPLFLEPRTEDSEVGEVYWPTKQFDPARPLSPRAREACRLAATGMKQGEIRKKLGFSQSWLSLLLKSEKGQAEIERFHDKLFERAVADRIKELGTPAMNVFEDVLTTNNPEVKPALKLDAAKWVAEKISGKAKQEVEYTNNVFVQFLDGLKQMKDAGQIIEVSSTPAKVLDAGNTESTEEISDERKKLDAFLGSDL